jgi:GTP-binding protein EngB required for normal cell division
MGVTGAGKSSFISLLSDKLVAVGHDLQACTQSVEVYACKLFPGRNIYLIDTPGFDDTNRSDTEVLRELATWLTDSYSNNINLKGIVYFHRITDVRMQGSAKKNLVMFKKLCGDEALKNVILATSMWDRVSEEEGTRREQQLIETPEFWGWMIGKGSKTFRHNYGLQSAKDLLRHFLTDSTNKITLDLQQMVNENKSLDETGAGKELAREFEITRERFIKDLKDAQFEMEEAIRKRDRESMEAIRELQAEYQAHIKRLEKEQMELKISMDRLHQLNYQKLEAKLAAQQEQMLSQLRTSTDTINNSTPAGQGSVDEAIEKLSDVVLTGHDDLSRGPFAKKYRIYRRISKSFRCLVFSGEYFLPMTQYTLKMEN